MASPSEVADAAAGKVEQQDDTLSPRDQQGDPEDRGLGKRKAEEEADHDYAEYNTKSARRDGAGDPCQLDPIVQDKLQAMQQKGVVRPGELDDRALRDLSGFAPDVAIRILDEFEECDMAVVRNKAAFLGGVMNRYLRQPGPKLPHDIQQRLDSMFRARKLRSSDLDAKCYESLSHVPIKAALLALERFGARDLSEIRNLSAFFMSMLRAAEKESQVAGGSHSYGVDTYGRDTPVYDGGRGGASYRSNYAPSSGVSYTHGNHHSSTPAHHVLQRRHHGQDQRLAGVRVDEFHALADCAVNVPAAVALKLQTLWDAGVRLVSQLDDRSWEALADLPAPEGLAAVDETAAAMERPGGLRNVNAYFMSVAGKLLNKQLSLNRHIPAATSYSSYDRGASYDEPTRAGYSGTASVQSYRGTSAGTTGYAGAAVGGSGRGHSRTDVFTLTGRDPPANRGVCAMHMLTDTVRDKAERIIARSDGMVRPDHFDEGVCTLLRRLGNDGALAVLDEVLTNDLNVVRNMPAYIMGICKRHQATRR